MTTVTTCQVVLEKNLVVVDADVDPGAGLAEGAAAAAAATQGADVAVDAATAADAALSTSGGTCRPPCEFTQSVNERKHKVFATPLARFKKVGEESRRGR